MLCQRLVLRASKPADQQAINDVETSAYGRKNEANLVDRLLPAPAQTISIVADCDDQVIGHILLTEIEAPVKSLALAPLAVVPQFREMQVGTQLVRAGLKAAEQAGFQVVFALGDVAYYERFGFSAGLADPFKVNWQGKRFMALELVAGALKGKSGKLLYPEAFSQL